MTTQLKSREQHLADMVRSIRNSSDLTDFSPGAALGSVLESIATKIFQAQLGTLRLASASNIANLVGSELDNQAVSIGLPNGVGGIGREPAAKTSGPITITSAFNKISTFPVGSKPPPYTGSMFIYATDASSFTNTGNLYIGRNSTTNFEGPIAYTSVVNNGNYWTISLSSPLTKNHAYTDEVTLAQGGNRTISAGTQVIDPPQSGVQQLTYTVDVQILIPDGESTSAGTVTCTQFGSIGNINVNSITQFITPPYTGAKVTNSQSFNNGKDPENDNSLRQRIIDFQDVLARGTETAIKNALVGVTDPASGRTITSVSVVEPASSGQPVEYYIDDGSGLEPVFQSQGYELLLANASGKEQSFGTAQYPITPAMLLGNNQGPFVLTAGDSLTFVLDEERNTFTINPEAYRDLRSATASEVVSDLNSQTSALADLVNFRTTNNRTQIVVFDSSGEGEQLAVEESNLQTILGLPLGTYRPIYVYLNSVLQSFRGEQAILETQPFTSWSGQSNPYNNVAFKIDNVVLSPFSVTNSDFTAIGVTLATASINNWVSVLSTKIPGVSISAVNGLIRFVSNKGLSSNASVSVYNSTAGANGFITTQSRPSLFSEAETATGTDKNYDLNRFTGELTFVDRVPVGSVVEVASLQTKAFITSSTPVNGVFNVSSSSTSGNSILVVGTDGTFTTRATGLSTPSATATITNDTTNYLTTLTDTASTGVFDNVHPGDYVFLTEKPAINGSNFPNLAGGALFPVAKISLGTTPPYIVLEVSDWDQTNVFNQSDIALDSTNFRAFASSVLPQIVNFGTNTTLTANQVLSFMNPQLVNSSVVKFTPTQLQLASNNYSEDGKLAVLVSYGNALNLFPEGSAFSIQAQVAAESTQDVFGVTPVIQSIVYPTDVSAGYGSSTYLYTTFDYTDVTSLPSPDQDINNPLDSVYPLGFQADWVTGKFYQFAGRVYNETGSTPYPGILRGTDSVPSLGTASTPTANLKRYDNLSMRLTDLSLSDVDNLVVQMNHNPTSNTFSIPMGRLTTLTSVTYSPPVGSAQGSVFQAVFADPNDGPPTPLPYNNALSPFIDFNFEDFNVLVPSTGYYRLVTGSDPVASLVLTSGSYGSPSLIRFNVNYPTLPSQSNVIVSHQNMYLDNTVETVMFAYLKSGPAVSAAIMNTGSYTLSAVGSITNNTVQVTLNSSVSEVTASSTVQALTFSAATPTYSGTAGNNITVTVVDSGPNVAGGASYTDSVGSKTTVIELAGTTPNAATLSSILNSPPSTLLSNTVTGSGTLNSTLSPFIGGAKASATGVNGTFTIGFQAANFGTYWNNTQVNLSVSASVNSYSQTVTPMGTVVTINIINTATASQAQTFINGVANAVVTCTVASGSPVANVSVVLSGGANQSASLITIGGVDSSVGGINPNFIAGNVVVIGGSPTAATNLFTGAWKIQSNTSGTITFTVPYYNNFPAVNSVFSATNFPLSSYTPTTTLPSDINAAINTYFNTYPIITSVQPNVSMQPNVTTPTFLLQPNGSTIESYVNSVSSGLIWHSHNLQNTAPGSIVSYDNTTATASIVIQSQDPFFPNDTAFSAVGQNVMIVPSNSTTLSRWMDFAAVSGLPLFATVDRTTSDTNKVQVSSTVIGSSGAVFVNSTSANSLVGTPAMVPFSDNGSIRVSMNQGTVASYTKGGLVLLENSELVSTNRPYRVGYVPSQFGSAHIATGTGTNGGFSMTFQTKNVGAYWNNTVVHVTVSGSANSYVQTTSFQGTIVTINLNSGDSPSAAQSYINGVSGAIITCSATTGSVIASVTATLVGAYDSSVTTYNPVDTSSWFTPASYVRATVPEAGVVRVEFIRQGTRNISDPAGGFLTDGNITFTSLGNGLWQVTAIQGGRSAPAVLAARVGDMMFVPPTYNPSSMGSFVSQFTSDVQCPQVGTNTNPTKYSGRTVYSGSTDMIYPGYPVVNIIDAQNVVIIAPHITQTSGYTVTSLSSDEQLQFIPMVFAEKNIATNMESSVEGLSTSITVGATTQPMRYILKALSNNIMMMVVSNQSTYSADSMELATFAVSTDDIISLYPPFNANNQGSFRVIAHDGTKSIYFYNPAGGLDEVIDVGNDDATATSWGMGPISTTDYPKPFRIYDAESNKPGNNFIIGSLPSGLPAGTNWFVSSLLGNNQILDMGIRYVAYTGLNDSGANGESSDSSVQCYVDISAPTVSLGSSPWQGSEYAVNLNTFYNLLGFGESTPYSGLRLVDGWSPTNNNIDLAELFLSPDRFANRINPLNGTTVKSLGKIGFPETTIVGVDGYRVHSGLVQQGTYVIDGVPSNPNSYPGVKADGTRVEILPPLLESITMNLLVRPQNGVLLSALTAAVQSGVQAFVDQLGVGQALIISALIADLQTLPGVQSVSVTATTPVVVDDRIATASDEKIIILNLTSDIVVGGF